MIIEPERPEHISAIRRLHVEAFPTEAEANLVDRLRDDGDAVTSLVCCEKDRVIGHVLFSRMRAPFRALALAPVSTAERYRRQGIAARLIEDGIARARAAGWDAIFVLGEPGYYGRFGFSAENAEGFISPYAGPYFMMRDLTQDGLPARTGPVAHAPAFAALG